MGHKSVSVKYTSKIFALNGGFQKTGYLLNKANLILPQPTLVVITTKFETK